ncbi:MAG TPA: hypothetical protein VGQ68_07635 [Gaiellaceae bacterium]|nr:hypothetical protein [Gaiellaceae bacterium]
MTRRWLPIAIAIAAAGAEAAGAPTIAFYLLLTAVPVSAGCALALLGELLDARAVGPVEPVAALEPLLAGLALLLLVAGAAAGSVTFALFGCLSVYTVQAFVTLGAELRAPVPEPG